MSVSIGRIVAEITANTAGLRRGAADAERILSDTSQNASAAGKAIKIAFAVTAALGVVKLIDKLEDCTQVAMENKKAMLGLESVAKAYGASVEDATRITKEFTKDGLIQMKNASTGMKNILSTGFNITEAMNLSQALKDIGAFNNVVVGGLGVAFEDVTKGMRTGSIELIENIGLTQRLSQVMKQAQKQAQASGDTEKARQLDISNGIDLSTNAAQREAFYNMVLKEGEKFKGNAAKLADSQASSQVKANAAVKEAADAIGTRLLPSYSALMTTITALSKMTTDIFKETEFEKANDKIMEQKIELGMLSTTYINLKDKVNKTTGEQEAYNTAISELQRMYPDYLNNLDLNNMKTETAKNLLSQLNDEMDIKFIKMQAEAANADLYKQSTEELKREVSATLQLNKALSEKAEWEKSEDYKKGYTKDFATPIKYYQKIKDEAVKKQKEIQVSIKGTEDYYAKVLETAQNRRKKYFFEPTKLFNTNNPDADKYTVLKEPKKKKESFSLDTTESTKQKLIEQEYKYKTDLANAKEEEKWRVELENRKAVAIINATAENEKNIAKIREKVESGKLPESEGKKQAQTLNEQLAKDIGQLEVDTALKINYHIDENAAQESAQNAADFYAEEYEKRIKSKLDEAQKAADFYAKKFEEQYKGSDLEKLMSHFDDPKFEKKEPTYVNKSLEDVTKSFADLASVLDNDVLNALSNVASQAMNMKGSISGFSAAQGAGDVLGMLSGGIGIFTSAVSIFQTVGTLFNKSTYNFDEAVEKMLKGIGEKTPEIQTSIYAAAALASKMGVDTSKKFTDVVAPDGSYGYQSIDGGKELKEALDKAYNSTVYGSGHNVAYYDKVTGEHVASVNDNSNAPFTFYEDFLLSIENLAKIIPQLADQLGTAAGDFGSAIGSALSSATTSEELKANLYDSIYGTVKSGLINAFLAGEVMKPLLNNLQETVTLAIASGDISPEEKTAIQAILGDVGIKTDTFYSALEAVGLNVVDAAGQLNQAADRMDNVNRNLRLADRISTITTQNGSYGIPPALGGGSSIVYDFSNANLGGMTEQQVISAVSKANRMASIRKVGV